MIKYILIEDITREMDLDEAIEYLKIHYCFNLDTVTNVEQSDRQSELIETLLDAFFLIEDVEEDDDDYWEDDREEREREYRKMQGF